jgi:hypothetical protein
MATDGPTPAPCNPEVFSHGEVMLVTHSISSNRMEQWVKKVAKISGQPVDWHFVGGRAVIKALGDITKVRSAMDDLFPLLEDLRRASSVTSTSLCTCAAMGKKNIPHARNCPAVAPAVAPAQRGPGA